MGTLTVGTGRQYSTLAAAVAASRDGDVLELAPGTYLNDFATIKTRITIVGITGADGSKPHLKATVSPPNGKAILTTTTDVTINNVEMSGSKVADRNGAAIRHENGTLTLLNSKIHDNENGILSGGDTGDRIIVRRSEFYGNNNDQNDGRAHQIYAGKIGTLEITDSYFHDNDVGHHIKSRAASTLIQGNVIDDASGTTSYEIDVPNAGNAVIRNNFIRQSAGTGNPNIIAYGEEGVAWSSNSLLVEGNVISNMMASGGIGVWNAASIAAVLKNNQFYHVPTLLKGSGSQTGTVQLSSAPTVPGWSGGTYTPTPTPSPTPTPAPSPTPTPTDPTTGSGGADSLSGGGNADTLRGMDGNDVLYGRAGNDRLEGGNGADRLFGEDGNDIHLYGNAGNDTIYGGAGNDVMMGGQDNDWLFGDVGNDTLMGELGNDVLYGGTGKDQFTFNGPAGIDRIADFRPAEEDKIRLVTGGFSLAKSAAGNVLLNFSAGGSVELSGIAYEKFSYAWVVKG